MRLQIFLKLHKSSMQ